MPKWKRPIERQKPIYSPPEIGGWIFGFGVVVFMLFVVCAVFMFNAREKEALKAPAILLSACWVVGVPIFFFFEHAFFFRRWGDPGQYEQFKRLQDQAAKIWAAAIVVLGALFARSFPGGG